MDLDALSRHQLQQLCKEHNIKANLSSKELITLLQTHLSSQRQSHASERTRAGRTPVANRPLSHPPVPEDTPAVPTRTRESNRRSRTTSRSASATTAAVVPEPEATTVESEKENKRDPVRRKARESQKRLGVGKPRAAGGTGPRTVTRIVPSRASSAGGRTRARVDPVEGATRMEVVIEEPEGEPPLQRSSNSSPRSSAQPGTSQSDPSAVSRKISAIEAQISQLYSARDSLLSKLAVQERELVSIRDDIIVDHSKITDDMIQQMESRLSQQVVEASAQHSQTLKLLEVERQRVARLEGQLETLVQRLGTLESRLVTSEAASACGISVTPDSAVPDPNTNQPVIDPGAFLDFSADSKDDFAPSLLAGSKRAASAADEERNVPTRASKRARHEPYTYTTAARLEDALTHPISPASAPAASSLPPVPAPETPRTPPMTRHSRRQLALPPASPGGLTPSQIRLLGAMPPSPTTDSPRKGIKGKGKDSGSLLLASPTKAKRLIQGSKAPAKDASAIASRPGGKSPPPAASSSLLAGVSTEGPLTLPSDSAAGRIRAASTSPAFPVFEPPSRLTRRAGAGASLGLGRPPIDRPNNTTIAPSPAPLPGGLLPAFSLAGRPSHSGHTTADETDDTNTNGTTPGGEIMSADEMLTMHQEPVTPMLSGVVMGSTNDSWGGFASPEDGPPSPDKRTLYGTEVLPSERRGSGRVDGFPLEEDWM